MIFAAGLGTRLGELTRTTPKALVPVAGIPMLERVARRLIEAGVGRLVVNVHHHADQIVDFIRRRDGFGVDYAVSYEADQPLDTGGGLKHAARLFEGEGPFFIHNVDIISRIPLREMYAAHRENAVDPVATLAVMERPTMRYLLFDEVGLVGREDETKSLRFLVRPAAGDVRRLPFGGVHVVSRAVFELLPARDVFSINDVYLDAVSAGYTVAPYEVEAEGWVDIGSPERLAAAERLLEERRS